MDKIKTSRLYYSGIVQFKGRSRYVDGDITLIVDPSTFIEDIKAFILTELVKSGEIEIPNMILLTAIINLGTLK